MLTLAVIGTTTRVVILPPDILGRCRHILSLSRDSVRTQLQVFLFIEPAFAFGNGLCDLLLAGRCL